MFRVLTASAIAVGLAGIMLSPLAAEDGAKPENYTAEVMHRLCLGSERDEDADIQRMICTFRLQGVANIMIENCASTASGYQPAPALSASPPPSRGALRQAFMNYVEAHPAEWGEPWHIVAARATSGNFPCKTAE